MKFLVSSYLFVNEKLNAKQLKSIKASGFSNIEIFCYREHFDWDDRAQYTGIQQTAKELGIEIYSFHAPWDKEDSFNISSTDSRKRQMAVESVLAAIQTLSQLGGKALIIHPGSEPPKDASREQCLALAADALKTLSLSARELGIEIVIENTPPAALGANAFELAHLFETLKDYRVSFCLDTGHAFLSNGGLDSFFKLGIQPKLMHLSDNMGSNDDHLTPGEGKINWKELMISLKKEFPYWAEDTACTLEIEVFPGEESMRELKAWWEEIWNESD